MHNGLENLLNLSEVKIDVANTSIILLYSASTTMRRWYCIALI